VNVFIESNTDIFGRTIIKMLVEKSFERDRGMIRAIRHRRESDDMFFWNGNQVSLYDSSPQVIFYIDECIESSSDIIHSEKCDMNIYDEISSRCRSFPCSITTCHQRFHSILDFQNHYERNHVYQCSICDCTLHTDHLLDLHIQEKHDSYFITALEKGKAFYRCLCYTCACQFDHEKDRLYHMQNVHGYPRWFRFHPRANKISTKPSNHGYEYSRNEFDKSESFRKNNRPKVYQPPSSLEITHDNDIRNVSVNHIPRTVPVNPRNERRKIKNASIPCKYYLGGHCRRGSRCMFLHSNAKNEIDISMDMIDDLTERFHTVTPFEGGGAKRKTRIRFHSPS